MRCPECSRERLTRAEVCKGIDTKLAQAAETARASLKPGDPRGSLQRYELGALQQGLADLKDHMLFYCRCEPGQVQELPAPKRKAWTWATCRENGHEVRYLEGTVPPPCPRCGNDVRRGGRSA